MWHQVPSSLAVMSRVALPVSAFAVFFKTGFLIFDGLNDLLFKREDGTGNGTGCGNDAKEETFSEVFHNIDPYHFNKLIIRFHYAGFTCK